MRWAIVHHHQVLYRGSRKDVLAAADRFGLAYHVVDGIGRDGKPGRVQIAGRGFYDDCTEIPARLHAGAVIMPEDMLPARHRRRAA